MARGANRKIKILYLMDILLKNTDEEHGLTTDELISALKERGVDAERKTIYDDIEVLSTFGIDIEKRKGKSTTYHVVSREFELPELKLLVDAVQASKFITHKKSRELIKKIEGFLSRYDAQKLQRQVYVANRIKTMNESIYYAVDRIHEAINADVKVRFQYFGWTVKKEKYIYNGGKYFEISPFALTWDDENYYMIGYDDIEGKSKHYRVDKMMSISLTDEKRVGAEYFENFDMALYSKRTFGMFGGKEERVTLRCRNKCTNMIIDRFGTDVPLVVLDQHHFEAYVNVHTSPLFYTWLMNFGADVEIVAPVHVREEFVALAKDILKNYE